MRLNMPLLEDGRLYDERHPGAVIVVDTPPGSPSWRPAPAPGFAMPCSIRQLGITPDS